MTDAARYQQLIDAALAYGDAWRARKTFNKEFRQEPRVGQGFLKATAAQLDKNVTDSRRDLERVALRFVKRSVRTKKISTKNKPRKEIENDEEKCVGFGFSGAGNDCDAAAVGGISKRQGE